MRPHSNTLSHEFLADLREAAIRSKAAPSVIHQIDALQSCEDLEDDLEKADEEITAMGENRDDLREELRVLLLALAAHESVLAIDALQPAFKTAYDALKRHGASDHKLAHIARELGI